MNNTLKHILLVILLFLIYGNIQAQELTVMSFNIRYDNKNDQQNSWDNRKKGVVKLLAKYRPAILGVQEALLHQIEYIQHNLPNYQHIGLGRNGKNNSEFSAIFYDTTKFKILKEATFWLSKTPDKVSKGWDAALPRICTYGQFENIKTHEQFWIFNTHFDHIGERAKRKSAKLILKKIKKVNIESHPVILLGDFNSTPESKPIRILNKQLNDAMSISTTILKGSKGTLNGFNPNELATKRIDYIFSLRLTVVFYTHILDRLENSNFISDHYPVLVHFKNNKAITSF